MAGAQGVATLTFDADAQAAQFRSDVVVSDSNPTNINWTIPTTQLPAGTSNTWATLAYGGGTWIACTFSDNAATSTDGVTWSAMTVPLQRVWISSAYGNGVFVVVATDRNCAVSANGVSWSTHLTPPPSAGGTSGVCFGGGRFVVVCSSGSDTAGYSTDGQTWVPSTLPSLGNWTPPVYGDGGFITMQGSTFAKSSDGSSWSSGTLPTSLAWYSAGFGNGTYVAVHNSGAVYSKDGGTSWGIGSLPQGLVGSVNTIAFGGGRFIAVLTGGNGCLSSIDGVTWEWLQGSPYISPWNGACIAYANGTFIATANGSNFFAYLKQNTRTVSTVNTEIVPAKPSPGSNIATATVTGQAGLLATHAIDAWVQGSDSTADFTGHEHKHLPIHVAVTNVVPGVGFDITAYSDLRLEGDFKVRWAWTDNANTGSALVDFGTGFGETTASVVVTGITALTAGSNVQAWVQGTDSTADNTSYEHTYIPIRLRVTDKIAGTGFTIRAQSDFRLTGQFKVRYAFTT